MKSDAYKAFDASMNIGVEEWRDGIGFNLDALQKVTKSERDELVKILSKRLEANPDWREIEALGAIGTAPAKAAIRRALKHSNGETQLRAAETLAEMGEPADLESAIIEALRTTTAMAGLAKAIDMAEQHPSPRIQETLLDLAVNGDEYQRVHCAALALYLGGKAKEAFDWDHRPFFLKFGEDDRAVQVEAYKELCRRLGVVPKDTGGDATDLPVFKYHRDPLQSGSVVKSKKRCRCCGKQRGYIYQGPAYCEEELEEGLCPWCISDGSAHAKFDATFMDEAALPDDLSESIVEEVAWRTPGYDAWQYERWFSCCNDAMVFLEPVGLRELRARYQELEFNVLGNIIYDLQVSGGAATRILESLDRRSGPTAFIFQCSHCNRYQAFVDRKG